MLNTNRKTATFDQDVTVAGFTLLLYTTKKTDDIQEIMNFQGTEHQTYSGNNHLFVRNKQVDSIIVLVYCLERVSR
jgi:hypothetical protein